jgi:putative ABC transport system permease protein
MLHDLRHAARALARTPAFTLAAVLTLALGLGANTAMFSVVDAALLRPLPFHDPERLVLVWETMGDWKTRWVAPANFLDWRRDARSFDGLAGYSTADVNLSGAGEPERLKSAVVSDTLFDLLGARPALGRVFARGEDESGARLALLSDALWRRRFGADPSVVGHTVRLNGEAHEVVGVMPPAFRFPANAELWVPGRQGIPFVHSVMSGQDMRTMRDSHLFTVVGRLAAGRTPAAAQAEMDAIAARLARTYPDTNAGLGVNVASLRDHLVGDVRPALAVLAGAVGFVLLIACANVAGLLLARAAQRAQDTAVRLALGAGRARLVRQGLAEALLLSAAGGVLGVGLAYWGVEAIVALSPADVAGLAQARPDARVLGFAGLVSLATAALFGLVPAAQAARPDLGGLLASGVRTSGGPGRARARRTLVVAEIAMAYVLLVGAGLMLSTLARLRSVDVGLDGTNLLTFQVSLSDVRYREPHRRRVFFDGVLDAAHRLPGVTDAGAVMRLPLADGPVNRGLSIEGRPAPQPGEDHSVDYQVVSPSYFAAARIPLVRGRALAGSDREGAPRVVVINEAAVRRYFRGQDPIGQRVGMGDGDDEANWRTIVGVVGDVRQRGPDQAVAPAAFAPYGQDRESWNMMSFVLRTSVDPRSLAGAAAALVRAGDPEQPVSNVRTMDEVRAAAVVRPRFVATLLAAFGASAVLLAAIGIYGLIAYTTAQRTQELGVRMALGATRRRVTGLVLGEGTRLAALGVALGFAAALALSGVVAKLLFGVRPTDPVTLAGVALLVAVAAAAACWLPARRAAGVDPAHALRSA